MAYSANPAFNVKALETTIKNQKRILTEWNNKNVLIAKLTNEVNLLKETVTKLRFLQQQTLKVINALIIQLNFIISFKFLNKIFKENYENPVTGEGEGSQRYIK